MAQTIASWPNRTLRRLLKSQSGNVLMFYGFAVIPLTFSVGMGIDYARAMTTQTKLNAAADAAALNSVSQTMMIQSTTNACNAARSLFEAQAAGLPQVVIDSVTYSIKKADGTEIGCDNITDDAAPVDKRFVTVSYRARSRNMFGGILGWNDLAIGGGSGTYASVAPDIDFYIALDTSASMALPTTTAGIDALQTATGCTFACHSNKLEAYVKTGTGHINRHIADSTLMGIVRGNYGTGSVTLKTSKCQKTDKSGKCTSYDKVYSFTRIDPSGRYVFDNKPTDEVSVPASCKVGTLDKCVYNPNPTTQGIYADSYWYALNKGIRLRVDDQKSAVQDLMELADRYARENKARYQAALFKFDHANHGNQGVTRVSTLTSNLPAVSTAADSADLSILHDLSKDNGSNGNGCPLTGCTASNRYLYTSFKSILTSLSTGGNYAIPNPGNGTKTPGDRPQAYVFLITDGMSDEYVCNASNVCNSGRTRSAMQDAQIAQCNALKARNVKVAILYTEYTYESIENDEAGQRAIAERAIKGLNGQKSIAQALTECASPGLMYTVRTDESISNALQALFSKALATARIVQ